VLDVRGRPRVRFGGIRAAAGEENWWKGAGSNLARRTFPRGTTESPPIYLAGQRASSEAITVAKTAMTYFFIAARQGYSRGHEGDEREEAPARRVVTRRRKIGFDIGDELEDKKSGVKLI